MSFGTQPQIITQGDTKRKDTDTIARTVAGTVLSHNFIQASKRKPQITGFSFDSEGFVAFSKKRSIIP
jgi:hypothetical protein